MYEKKMGFISACVFCCSYFLNVYRYGLLCGSIMFLLRYVEPAWSQSSGSGWSSCSQSDGPQTFRTRWRGGGGLDPGISTHDATVDNEMFLSEYSNDGTAVRKRPLLPRACTYFTGRLEGAEMATAAETCADGACSLHSIWGSVIFTPDGNYYDCEDARQKLCEEMPTDVGAISNSPCGPAVRELLDNIWSDAIGYIIRRTREEPSMPGLLSPFSFCFYFISSPESYENINENKIKTTRRRITFGPRPSNIIFNTTSTTRALVLF